MFRFGGPDFNPTRMTWIKPSFAWVLYRSGYGRKHNQTRILKVKLAHEAVAGKNIIVKHRSIQGLFQLIPGQFIVFIHA